MRVPISSLMCLIVQQWQKAKALSGISRYRERQTLKNSTEPWLTIQGALGRRGISRGIHLKTACVDFYLVDSHQVISYTFPANLYEVHFKLSQESTQISNPLRV
jgi:hypothetical protein